MRGLQLASASISRSYFHTDNFFFWSRYFFIWNCYAKDTAVYEIDKETPKSMKKSAKKPLFTYVFLLAPWKLCCFNRTAAKVMCPLLVMYFFLCAYVHLVNSKLTSTRTTEERNVIESYETICSAWAPDSFNDDLKIEQKFTEDNGW